MQNTYDNQAQLLGTIVQDPLDSHSLYGENFYTFALHVKRLSDTADVLPVTVSERILGKAKSGQIVRVFGQVRRKQSADFNGICKTFGIYLSSDGMPQ